MLSQYRLLVDSALVDVDRVKFEKIETMAARKLLVADRLDLMVKIIYLEAVLNARNIPLAEKIYKQHIGCFSYGRFAEPGNKDKNSFDKYKESFDITYSSIATEGFDASKSVVPVSESGFTILDGAHRVSCAIKLGEYVSVVPVDVAPKIFNWEYFLREGMDVDALDFVVLSYIRSPYPIKKQYVMCCWPVGAKHDRLLSKEIESDFNVLYKKRVALSYDAAHCFLSQIYYKDPWVGSMAAGFQGVYAKQFECFDGESDEVVFYFVESSKNTDEVVRFKGAVREKLNLGKHLLHVTDEKSESSQIAELILNENTRNLLPFIKPYGSSLFIEQFRIFCEKLASAPVSPSDVCIVGGAVLALLGIRDSPDIDYVSVNTGDECLHYFDEKSSELANVGYDPIDVILDPKYHFYYMGYKFCTLAVVKAMKVGRGELKDGEDVALINLFLEGKSDWISKITRGVIAIRRGGRRALFRIRMILSGALKAVGLFPLARKFLKILKLIK